MTAPADPVSAPRLRSRLAIFARDIKVSHTIFAMPWAILSTVMAARIAPGGFWGKLGLIVICMVTARTVAMSANRLLDARLDALNPRTSRRAIPSGALSARFYWTILSLCAIVFLAAAAMFWPMYGNRWPAFLAAPVLAFLAAYPLLKRFTRLCHYYLGAALALAPVCAWVAIAGTLAIEPLLIAAAVMLWTAGFDIIYACQDYQSDLETGVVSVPSRTGIARALWIARFTHAACAAMLITLGLVSGQLRTLYFIGVAAAVALLIIEHSLVRANDLSKVNLAFFTINGLISVVLGTLGVLDVLLAV